MGVRSSLVACALLGLITPASAQTFSGIFFFGDSVTDSGRYLYLPKVVGDPATLATFGQHTTNPGPQYSILLGSYFGFPVTPSDAPGGGNNFAADSESPFSMADRMIVTSPMRPRYLVET